MNFYDENRSHSKSFQYLSHHYRWRCATAATLSRLDSFIQMSVYWKHNKIESSLSLSLTLDLYINRFNLVNCIQMAYASHSRQRWILGACLCTVYNTLSVKIIENRSILRSEIHTNAFNCTNWNILSEYQLLCSGVISRTLALVFKKAMALKKIQFTNRCLSGSVNRNSGTNSRKSVCACVRLREIN